MTGSELSAAVLPWAAVAACHASATPSLFSRSVSVQAAAVLVDRAQLCGTPPSRSASLSAASRSEGRQASRGGAHVEGGGETEYLPLTTAVTAWLDHAAQAIAAAPLQGGQAHSMRFLTSATPPVLGPTASAAEITNVASEQSVVQIAPAVHSAASSRLEESQHGTAPAGGPLSDAAEGSVAAGAPEAAGLNSGVLSEGLTSEPDRDGPPDTDWVQEAAASSLGSRSATSVAQADGQAAAVLNEASRSAAPLRAVAESGYTQHASIPHAHPLNAPSAAGEHGAAPCPHPVPQPAGGVTARTQPGSPVPGPLGSVEPAHQSPMPAQSLELLAGSASSTPGDHRPPLPPSSAGRRGESSVASAEGRGSSLRALKLRLLTTRGATIRGRPQSAPSSGAGEPLLQPRWSIAQPRQTSPSRETHQACFGTCTCSVVPMLHSYLDQPASTYRLSRLC